MAIATKTKHIIGDNLPLTLKLSQLESLMLSHLNYSAVLMTSLTESLLATLEKPLNWSIRACCQSNTGKSTNSIEKKIESCQQVIE